MILEEERNNVGVYDDLVHPSSPLSVAAPFVECLQKLLDRFLLRPEVAVKDGHVRNWSRTLLRHQFLNGRVAGPDVFNRRGAILGLCVRMLVLLSAI